MNDGVSIQDEVTRSIQSAIATAIKEKLSGYNSPLDKLLSDAVGSRQGQISELIKEGIDASLKSGGFRASVHAAIAKKLGDVLIQKFGGELEKQVNALKSDPTTRAQITIAIDSAVKSLMKPV